MIFAIGASAVATGGVGASCDGTDDAVGLVIGPSTTLGGCNEIVEVVAGEITSNMYDSGSGLLRNSLAVGSRIGVVGADETTDSALRTANA